MSRLNPEQEPLPLTESCKGKSIDPIRRLRPLFYVNGNPDDPNHLQQLLHTLTYAYSLPDIPRDLIQSATGDPVTELLRGLEQCSLFGTVFDGTDSTELHTKFFTPGSIVVSRISLPKEPPHWVALRHYISHQGIFTVVDPMLNRYRDIPADRIAVAVYQQPT